MKMGVVSYGLYIPADFETTNEVAVKAGLTPEEVASLGIKRKFLPSSDDQPVSMAVKAANQAFERSKGVSPTDIDVVIWTGEEHKDYIAQTASIRLQEEAGCRNAWAFDLIGQSVTLILGLRVARDLMIGDDTVNTVLLAGGTRNIDLVDYTNPNTRFLLPTSASGGAVIVQRGHNENRLLATAFTVDSEMADEVYVPVGGTGNPFSFDNLDSSLIYFQAAHPGVVTEYLNRRWAAALAEVVKKVLVDGKPDYLALRHLAPDERQRVLDMLHLGHGKSLSLTNWGHHGPNDVIISMDLGLKAGTIRQGSFVVLASGGIGFTYAAAMIQWGSA